MTKDELALLLYLETRAVDHGGVVAGEKMNADDFAIAKRWNDEGYLKFGRLKYDEVKGMMMGRMNSTIEQLTHHVTMTDQAFDDAHRERRARAERMAKSRNYKTVEEVSA